MSEQQGTEVSSQGTVRMLWLLECTFHKEKDLCLFCVLTSLERAEQCVAHSRCSVNTTVAGIG